TFAAELGPMAAPAEDAGGADLSQLPPEGVGDAGPRARAEEASWGPPACPHGPDRVPLGLDAGRMQAWDWLWCWVTTAAKAAACLSCSSVFQLCHQRYKPFIFAAETLADLSMSGVVLSPGGAAGASHSLCCHCPPLSPPDCYSETEAEDPDDESPRPGSLRDFGAALLLHCPFPHPGPSGEDLECLMRCLQQGGVSLIGRQQVLTQEQCRKSFIRRSKNPLINAKVHAVRALQSTLKAKLAELRALEQLLSDAALTSERFSRWKEEHQELYQELGCASGTPGPSTLPHSMGKEESHHLG
uniref:Connector enhancer of kinase suppressor of ras 1 n=1 Tax=Amazona collaria TaxID=241587 RepID=A0A8B9IUI2_9PSIT